MPGFCLIWNSEIDVRSGAIFTAYLNSIIVQGCSHLVIALNTTGGDVSQGVMIHNLLRAAPFPVTTHNIGSIASIGIPVFLGGSERKANSNSDFVFHAAGRFISQRMEEAHLVEALEAVRASNERITAIVSSRSDIAPHDCQNLIKQMASRNANWAQTAGVIQIVEEFVVPLGYNVQHLIPQLPQ